jgi:hypothetical protein
VSTAAITFSISPFAFVLADINECKDSRFRYPCSVPGTCVNTVGSYYCACPDKTTGNAYNGTCDDNKSQIGWQIAIGKRAHVFLHLLVSS